MKKKAPPITSRDLIYAQSVKTPLAVIGAARGAATSYTAMAPIGGFREIAALDARATVFASRLEITARLIVVPGVAPTNITIQAIRIGAEGSWLSIAIDVFCDGMTKQSAQHCAAHYRSAITLADSRTENAASDSPEDRTCGSVPASAAAFIVALLVVDCALIATVVIKAVIALLVTTARIAVVARLSVILSASTQRRHAQGC